MFQLTIVLHYSKLSCWSLYNCCVFWDHSFSFSMKLTRKVPGTSSVVSMDDNSLWTSDTRHYLLTVDTVWICAKWKPFLNLIFLLSSALSPANGARYVCVNGFIIMSRDFFNILFLCSMILVICRVRTGILSVESTDQGVALRPFSC